MQKNRKALLELNILLAVYSLSTVFSKMASGEEFLSRRFIVYYAMVIFILGIYAIFWQQIIKKIPLTVAYANRAITLAWGLLWGVILFHESITAGKVIGLIIVMAGIYLCVTDQEGKEE